MKTMNLKKKIAMLTASAIVLAGAGAIKAYAAIGVAYEIYNYNSESVIDSYMLYQHEYNETAAYSMVSTENRVVYNNSGIVRLSNGGTGFVVGDHTIATSASNIYNTKNNVHNRDLSIMLFDNAGNVSRTIYADTAQYPSNFRLMSTGRERFDYAFINVSEDLSGYEHFKLGEVMEEASNNTVIPVRTAGVYSGESGLRPYTSLGRFYDIYSFNVECSSVASNQQVGGPMYVTTVYRSGNSAFTPVNTVVGILSETEETYPYARGTRITSSLLQFYYQNENNAYD